MIICELFSFLFFFFFKKLKKKMCSNYLLIKGFIVRFCRHFDCDHSDLNRCPNAPLSDNKYYVCPSDAKRIFNNIRKDKERIPIIIGHDKTGHAVVGRVCDIELNEDGILIEGVINDYRVVNCFLDQFNVYKREYTESISFEQYMQNIFSSISLSHDPKTCKVNHIGLVNIPARLGTGIRYKLKTNDFDKPVLHSTDLVDIENIIAAHKVAFMRAPNRREILKVNGKYSYTPSLDYINASYKYNNKIDDDMNNNKFDDIFIELGKAVLSSHLSNLTNDGNKNILTPSSRKRKVSEIIDRDNSNNYDIDLKKPKVVATTTKEEGDLGEEKPAKISTESTSQQHQTPYCTISDMENMVTNLFTKMESQMNSQFSGINEQMKSMINEKLSEKEIHSSVQQRPETAVLTPTPQQQQISVEASANYPGVRSNSVNLDEVKNQLIDKLVSSVLNQI